MNRFFKKYEKHQKKLLAVFSVGLMIVFALPAMTQNGSHGDGVAATVQGREVMASAINAATKEWEYLTRDLYIIVDMQKQGAEPAAILLGRDFDINNGLRQDITQHPEMFYLLLDEARHSNGCVDPDTLRELESMSLVVSRDQRLEPVPPEDQPARNQALSDLLLINDMMSRIAALPKASVPQVQHVMTDYAELSLNLVELSAGDYLSRVAQPTAAEISAQYEKYKDALADSNPYGFSYRVPNRVKIEYLEINREQVRKAVEPTIDEIQAREYYHLHEGSFTTRPSTGAAAFDRGLGIESSNAATTQPFEAVRQEVISTLVRNETDARMDAVSQKIAAEMTDDFVGYQQAVYPQGQPPTTSPATETVLPATTQPMPFSSVGVAYTSSDYLPRLAARIKQQDSIEPTTAQPLPMMTTEALGALEEIGQASYKPKSPEQAMNGDVSLSSYALDNVRPLALSSEQQPGQPRLLSLLEPSQVLSDELGNRYIFRVVAADPAHAPPQVAVFSQIERDVKTLAALKLANDAAQKLISTLGQHHLRHAAAAQRLAMITTGLFDADVASTASIPDLPHDMIPESDRKAFMMGAYKLLGDGGAGVDPNHPVGTIELGNAQKVLVAEINQVRTPWQGEQGLSQFQYLVTYARPQTMSNRPGIITAERMNVLQRWFQWDAIKIRLNYLPKK